MSNLALPGIKAQPKWGLKVDVGRVLAHACSSNPAVELLTALYFHLM
ncbi:MAG TPA: hypothetical protein VIM33_00230 [Gaiellaceae bacterium]